MTIHPSNQNAGNSEEVKQDLNDFKETKKSINDLINYRRSVLTKKPGSGKIEEYEEKAMDALNNLFSGENQK